MDIFETLKQLRSRLVIDEYSLEKECRDHASLYAEIGELYVEAKGETRSAKENVDFVKAGLDGGIRLDPTEYGLTKVTEGSILSTIFQNSKYVIAFHDYLDKQKISGHFQILLSSAEQRKSMLRDCKDLFIYNYYSNIGLNKEANEVDKVNIEKYMEFKRQKHERELEADSRGDQRDV